MQGGSPRPVHGEVQAGRGKRGHGRQRAHAAFSGGLMPSKGGTCALHDMTEDREGESESGRERESAHVGEQDAEPDGLSQAFHAGT